MELSFINPNQLLPGGDEGPLLSDLKKQKQKQKRNTQKMKIWIVHVKSSDL